MNNLSQNLPFLSKNSVLLYEKYMTAPGGCSYNMPSLMYVHFNVINARTHVSIGTLNTFTTILDHLSSLKPLAAHSKFNNVQQSPVLMSIQQ